MQLGGRWLRSAGVVTCGLVGMLAGCGEDPADPTPPPAPTSVNVTLESPTKAVITWQAAAGADVYVIFRDGSALDTVTFLQYSDSVPAASTTYSYQILAMNSAGSSELSVAAAKTTPPASPLGVTATTSSWVGVTVSWGQVPGATSYVVYRTNGGASAAIDTLTETALIDTGLTPCTVYTYEIAAAGEGGISSHSAPVVITPKADPVKGVGLLVEKPNGCESYTVGDTMEIDWEIDSVKDGVLIEFSANNGLSFMIIGNALKGNPNYEHGPYKWAIPDTAYRSDGLTSVYTVSDSCLIRVKEYWALNIRDVSDRTFSIRARP